MRRSPAFSHSSTKRFALKGHSDEIIFSMTKKKKKPLSKASCQPAAGFGCWLQTGLRQLFMEVLSGAEGWKRGLLLCLSELLAGLLTRFSQVIAAGRIKRCLSASQPGRT